MQRLVTRIRLQRKEGSGGYHTTGRSRRRGILLDDPVRRSDLQVGGGFAYCVFRVDLLAVHLQGFANHMTGILNSVATVQIPTCSNRIFR